MTKLTSDPSRICKTLSVLIIQFSLLLISYSVKSQGYIARTISELQQKKVFSTPEIKLFSLSWQPQNDRIKKDVASFTSLHISNEGLRDILSDKPDYLRLSIPYENGRRHFQLVLYKADASNGGVKLLSNTAIHQNNLKDIVHYRGIIEDDENSVVAFTFSESETMALINNDRGNYVLGKLQDNSETFILYNDKDLIPQSNISCETRTPDLPGSTTNNIEQDISQSHANRTAKCVNWYWETDYDLFVSKGSLSNVNNYIQGIFNQVATLYANDGLSINLKTLFIWTTVDPYTGPSTSNYINQFGSYRTSWDGDLAHLIGFAGGGGIAYVNGLQMCQYGIGQLSSQMAYSGISGSYNLVPTYSWTVGCISHEQGHQLGSHHTHACAWNGNGTKIDDCGGSAGYSAGTCLPQPSPVLPVGGGTIMSYCHLTSVGINFNKGFGPLPQALLTNYINNSTCLTTCNSCSVPAQPGPISGNGTACTNISQTYSITLVTGATSYTWTLPAGWSGNSTTNTITATAGTTGGTITVKANNSCGSSSIQSLQVPGVSGLPSQPGQIIGNASVCPNLDQTYSINAVPATSSYTWTIPVGWTGTSTTNSITLRSGTTGGTITVKANNSCGSSVVQTKSLSVSSNVPPNPGSISGSTNLCAGVSQTYSTNLVNGATNYTWALPPGWVGSSTSNQITVTTGSSGGTLSVTANNNCGSSPESALPITYSNLPATPGAIVVSGGSSMVCSGDVRTYSVPLVNGLSYTWILPLGATIISGQGSNSIIIGFSDYSSAGVLSVKAINACGQSDARSLTIQRNIPATPGSISIAGGISRVCPGETRSYSVTALAGLTYQWTTPPGATIISGQGTSAVVVSFTSEFTVAGTLSVTAENGCGSSAARNLTITPNLPPLPGNIIVSGGIAKVCPGDTRTYTVSATTGMTYHWVASSGAIIINGQGTASITVNFTNDFTANGTISVAASNACGTSGYRNLIIYRNIPSLPSSVTVSGGILKVCPGDTRTYSVASVSGLTYTWTAPAEVVINSGQGTNSINVTYNPDFASSLDISVTANNSCGSSSLRTITVNRNLPAMPGAISGATNICPGSLQTYSVPAVTTVTSYIWNVPPGAVIQGVANGRTIQVLWGNAGGNISASATNSCGSSAARILAVNVNCPSPVIANPITSLDPQIFPNPTHGLINLKFYSAEETKYTIVLHDITGQVLRTESYKGLTGMNTRNYNWTHLANGIYIISIQNNRNRKMLKFEIW